MLNSLYRKWSGVSFLRREVSELDPKRKAVPTVNAVLRYSLAMIVLCYCLIGIPRLSQIVGHQVCTSLEILSFFSPFVSSEASIMHLWSMIRGAMHAVSMTFRSILEWIDFLFRQFASEMVLTGRTITGQEAANRFGLCVSSFSRYRWNLLRKMSPIHSFSVPSPTSG